MGNPVMLVVEIGAVITTVLFVDAIIRQPGAGGVHGRHLRLALVHGPLRQLRRGNGGRSRQGAGQHAARHAPRHHGPPGERTAASRKSPPPSLRKGDVIRVEAGETIAGDGDVIEGVAFVSEAAITGESAPVLKEPGTDIRSSVTGGTTVTSDWLRIRITSDPGETFLDRMIALVEGAERQKTPNEIALNILLAGFTIIFLLAVMTIRPFVSFVDADVTTVVAGLAARLPDPDHDRRPALGDRHRRHGPAGAAQRPRDVRPRRRDRGRHRHADPGQDRHDHLRQPPGRPSSSRSAATRETELINASLISSLADETPEGRSVVELARQLGYRGRGAACRRRADPVHAPRPASAASRSTAAGS